MRRSQDFESGESGAFARWFFNAAATSPVKSGCGAVSVHCVNGVWGTLAVGLFAAPPAAGYGNELAGLFYGGGFKFLGVQLLGAGVTAAWAFSAGAAIFFTLKKLGVLRVSAKTELKGLDLTEHGQDAYASFQFFSNI